MTPSKLAEFCAHSALEKKAENVLILDLREKSTVADYFVIASANSDRQVDAIAEHVADQLRQAGRRPNHTEGFREGRWALIDCGDVMVHIFLDYLREYYNLEGLWSEAPRKRVHDPIA